MRLESLKNRSLLAVDFIAHVDFGVGTNPVSVTTGDFDGDGKLDLVAANDLLSTLAHELGHLLGQGDVYNGHTGLDPMAGELAAGLRSLPQPGSSLDTLPTRTAFTPPASPVATVNELRQAPRSVVPVAAGHDALFADLGLTDWANVALNERPTDPSTASGRGRRKDRDASPNPSETRDALFAQWEEI